MIDNTIKNKTMFIVVDKHVYNGEHDGSIRNSGLVDDTIGSKLGEFSILIRNNREVPLHNDLVTYIKELT